MVFIILLSIASVSKEGRLSSTKQKETSKPAWGPDYRKILRESHDKIHNKGITLKDATNELFNKIECQNGNMQLIYDYKERTCSKQSDSINTEHIVPKSFYKEQLPMLSDLHNFYPVYSQPKGKRLNYRFGDFGREDIAIYCKGNTCTETKKKAIGNKPLGDYTLFSSSTKDKPEIFIMPTNMSKGVIARSVLYFYTMYETDENVIEKTSEIETLLRWNALFLPNEYEKERNRRIQQYQGTSNPYIDNPNIANISWASKEPDWSKFPGFEPPVVDPEGTETPDTPVTPENPDTPEIPDTEEGDNNDQVFEKIYGDEMRKKLRADNKKVHKTVTEDEAKRKMFNDIDCQDGNLFILYAKENISHKCGERVSGEKAQKENVVLNSFFTKDEAPMTSDLHNNFPTYGSIKSQRGKNCKFSEFGLDRLYRYWTGTTYYDQEEDAITAEEMKNHACMTKTISNKKEFMPPDEHKGMVARALLYTLTMYDVNVKDLNDIADIETALKWNRAFLPSDYEKERNKRVMDYQGNSNPFIEHPTLAEIAWANEKPDWDEYPELYPKEESKPEESSSEVEEKDDTNPDVKDPEKTSSEVEEKDDSKPDVKDPEETSSEVEEKDDTNPDVKDPEESSSEVEEKDDSKPGDKDPEETKDEDEPNKESSLNDGSAAKGESIEKASGSKSGIIIGCLIGIVLIIGVCVAIWFFVFRKSKDDIEISSDGQHDNTLDKYARGNYSDDENDYSADNDEGSELL